MSDDLYADAIFMWLEDDYDPMDDSDEDFVEICLKDNQMEGISAGAVLLLKQDEILPIFYMSQWGTTWTIIPVDLDLADRCSFCGRELSKAMKVYTNKDATLYLCPLCVQVDS